MAAKRDSQRFSRGWQRKNTYSSITRPIILFFLGFFGSFLLVVQTGVEFSQDRVVQLKIRLRYATLLLIARGVASSDFENDYPILRKLDPRFLAHF